MDKTIIWTFLWDDSRNLSNLLCTIKINRMIKLYKPLSIFLFILIASACSEDDPLPVPSVDFFLDPEVVEVNVPVMFDNLTTNASNYEWDFGDGQVVTDISPTVTFSSPGPVTVTLRAFTEDNQVDSLSQSFTVLERVLTGYIVNVFPAFNGAEAWDPNETGVEQFPDLVMQFLPDDQNNDQGFVDGIFVNRGAGPVGNTIDPNFNRVVLSDEDWTFILFDFDGDIDDIQLEDLEVMIGAQFNPLQSATFKNEAGDAGFVTVVLVDSENNVLDVDLTFELQ